MEAWSIDRAKIVFKDGDIIEGNKKYLVVVKSSKKVTSR